MSPEDLRRVIQVFEGWALIHAIPVWRISEQVAEMRQGLDEFPVAEEDLAVQIAEAWGETLAAMIQKEFGPGNSPP